MVNVVFFGAPFALYVLIVAMPRGRPALLACLVTAAGLVGLWLFLRFGAVTSEALHNVGFFGLLALSMAWFMASTLQLLRLRMPAHWPRWIWPAVAGVSIGAVMLVLMRFLGAG